MIMKALKIELLPTTMRLRQLIFQFGNIWAVIKPEQSVQCFHDSSTGIRIESIDGSHIRWVRPDDIQQRTEI